MAEENPSSPFFKTVYAMGTLCNGTDGYVQEGIRQLSSHDVHVKLLCYDHNTTTTDATINIDPLVYPYTNLFKTESLSRVVREVGGIDGLAETAVVMACNTRLVYPGDVTAEECLDTSVSLIRKGLTVFFLENNNVLYRSPTLDDYPELNLDTDRFLIITEPSLMAEQEAATLVGRELCRLKRGSSALRYAKVYENSYFNHTIANQAATVEHKIQANRTHQRIDAMVQGFRDACPTTELRLLWELSDWEHESESGQQLSAQLRREQVPDVVFAASDDAAELFLQNARDVLSPDLLDRLSTVGWYHRRPDLVEDRRILVTADTMVWQRILDLIELVEHHGVRSTRGWQQNFGLAPDAIAVEPPRPTVVSSDPGGYLLENRLRSYDARTSPSPRVEVSTGLLDVSIAHFLPFEDQLEAKLTQRASWTDPRLRWDSFLYDGSLQIGRERLWTPELYFENDYGSVVGTILAPPATVYSNGTVVLETVLRTSFFCSTGEDGRRSSYPFDSYHCSMDLARLHSWVSLDAGWRYNLISSDPYFTSTTSLQETPSVVHYQIYFERIKTAGWLRLVLPLVLINLVGFMSFWIPSLGEKVALGVTSLLCAIAFRDTVEMPQTAAMTWSELFLLLNVVFQILVLFITYCSYNVVLGNQLDRCLQACCICLHPSRYGPSSKKTDDALDDVEEFCGDSQQLNAAQSPHLRRRNSTRKFRLYNSGSSSGTHNEGSHRLNVDWFGRWVVVPAYFALLTILLIYGYAM